MDRLRVVKGLGVCLLLGLYACGSAEEAGDPRVGEQGKVKFTGGGGCNGSTTLASGSKAALTLEPQGGVTLPAGLSVKSSDVKVITASPSSSKGDRVLLSAVGAGSAHVELRAGGSLWDRLRFLVAPAGKVELDKPSSHAFAGATYVLKLGEVYGACKSKECALIGGGFLQWSAAPAGGLTLVQDVERTVTFTAGKTAGVVTLGGAAPGGGQALVQHKVEVLAAKEAATLTAQGVVALPRKPGEDLTVSDPVATPMTVPGGSLLMIRLAAHSSAGKAVPVWGRDIKWSISGDAGVVTLYPLDGQHPPAEGPIFSAAKAGKATLKGEVAVLGKSVTVEVTVQ